MGTTLPGGLKTIDEGQQGWETIVNYNSGLIDDLLAAAEFMAGLKLEWVSTSSVKVLPGACRSDDGVDNIILAAEITIALPGNLDTGSEAVDTWYYIWLFKRPVRPPPQDTPKSAWSDLSEMTARVTYSSSLCWATVARA